MRWSLSEEQTMFQRTFRGWLDHVGPPEARREWLDHRAYALFEGRLVANGWMPAGISTDLGGDGGGLLELCLAAEELGASALPSSAWLATTLAVPTLIGRPDLAEAALRSGRFVALLTPADQPCDQRQLEIHAHTDGRVLSGRVPSVLGADRAALFVVPATLDGALRLYLVDASAPGVSIRPRRLLDRSRSVADVELDAVPAAALDVAAEVLLRQAALRAAVLIAADALGAARRMLEMAVAYSKDRQQFGVPIGSFQAVKHAAATMLVDVESTRSVVYFAASSVDAALPEAPLHAAAAKAQTTEAATRVAESALTVHGAIGYTYEYDLQLFYKRAKLDRELFGAPAVWNERIASSLPLVPEVEIPAPEPERASA